MVTKNRKNNKKEKVAYWTGILHSLKEADNNEHARSIRKKSIRK